MEEISRLILIEYALGAISIFYFFFVQKFFFVNIQKTLISQEYQTATLYFKKALENNRKVITRPNRCIQKNKQN